MLDAQSASNSKIRTHEEFRFWPRLGQKRLDFGVAGTAHHIGNESSAFKTSSPTSVTCQSKFRSYLPPALVILRFDPASASSGPIAHAENGSKSMTCMAGVVDHLYR